MEFPNFSVFEIEFFSEQWFYVAVISIYDAKKHDRFWDVQVYFTSSKTWMALVSVRPKAWFRVSVELLILFRWNLKLNCTTYTVRPRSAKSLTDESLYWPYTSPLIAPQKLRRLVDSSRSLSSLGPKGRFWCCSEKSKGRWWRNESSMHYHDITHRLDVLLRYGMMLCREILA